MSFDRSVRVGKARDTLAQARRAAAGETSEGEARAFLTSQLHDLTAEREAFALAGRDYPPVQAQPGLWMPAIDTVLAAYDGSRQAIEAILEHLAERGSALDEAVNAFEAAANQLQLATGLFQGRLMTEGDSNFPVQNVMVRAVAAVRDGALPRESFVELLSAARAQFESGRQQVQVSAATEPREAVEALDAAFGQCLAALDDMGCFVDDGDEAHLFGGLAQLEGGQVAADEAFALMARLKLAAGPTSSPLANAFVGATAMLRSGQMTPESFKPSLESLAENVARMRREFERSRGTAAASATLAAQVPRLAASIEKHEEAVAAYRSYLEDGDAAHLEAGNAAFIEAISLQDAARAAVEGGGLPQVLCPQCGAVNDGAARNCAQCEKLLPRLAIGHNGQSSVESSTGDPDLVLTDHIKRVLDDANRALNGVITPQEFRATVDWMGGLVAQVERSLSGAGGIKPENFGDDEREQAQVMSQLVEDTRAMLADGIRGMRNALAEFRAFVDGHDAAHLSAAMPVFWAACKQVYQAQRVGQMAAVRLSPQSSVRVAPPPDDEDAFDMRESLSDI